MKKVLLYVLIVIVGASVFYYSLTIINRKDDKPKKENKEIKEQAPQEIAPTKDSFVNEAIRIQSIAESKGENETCKCYNVKELDSTTTLTGSILVYTVDDLFISTMWLSNGYYILNNSENAAVGLLEDSSETASIYCGEKNSSVSPSLCASNY